MVVLKSKTFTQLLLKIYLTDPMMEYLDYKLEVTISLRIW